MAITLNDIKGFDFNNEGATTEAVWLTDWDTAAMTAYEMVGGYKMVGGVLQRLFPQPCPYFTGLVCKTAKVSPVGDWNPVSGGYYQAWITATYGVPRADDTLQANPIDYFTIKTSVSAEAMSIPGKCYKWAVSVGNPAVANVAINEGELLTQKWMANTEITMASTFFEKLQLDVFREKVGKVNSGVMVDPEGIYYPAETVLFVGVQQERKLTPEGYAYAPRELKFLVRDNIDTVTSIGGKGWNHFWCEKYVAGYGEGSWQEVTPKPYETTDFDDLFIDVSP